jgi:hypothetical protein
MNHGRNRCICAEQVHVAAGGPVAFCASQLSAAFHSVVRRYCGGLADDVPRQHQSPGRMSTLFGISSWEPLIELTIAGAAMKKYYSNRVTKPSPGISGIHQGI